MTIALLEVAIINQLCNLMQLTNEERRKVLNKINRRCEADFVVTTSAAGQAKVAKKVHQEMLSTPVRLSDKLRLRSDCFLCYKPKLWLVGIKQWYTDSIEQQAKPENDFKYIITSSRITHGDAQMWSFFETNVRADREAAVRGGTEELADEEARMVISTGKARFLEEAPAAMKR